MTPLCHWQVQLTSKVLQVNEVSTAAKSASDLQRSTSDAQAQEQKPQSGTSSVQLLSLFGMSFSNCILFTHFHSQDETKILYECREDAPEIVCALDDFNLCSISTRQMLHRSFAATWTSNSWKQAHAAGEQHKNSLLIVPSCCGVAFVHDHDAFACWLVFFEIE
jgi:hypothetical protein